MKPLFIAVHQLFAFYRSPLVLFIYYYFFKCLIKKRFIVFPTNSELLPRNIPTISTIPEEPIALVSKLSLQGAFKGQVTNLVDKLRL